ncbi:MAG: FeoA family protein [Raoultibacter sp.]
MVLSEVKKMGEYHVRQLHEFGGTHHRLEELGFVPGQVIIVISRMGDGLIVNVKGSRVALTSELARNIVV